MILACGGWTSVSWEGLFGGLADLLLLTGKQVLGVFTPLIVGSVVVGALAALSAGLGYDWLSWSVAGAMVFYGVVAYAVLRFSSWRRQG